MRPNVAPPLLEHTCLWGLGADSRQGRGGAEASRPGAPWSTPVPGPKVSSCFSQQEHTEILHSLRFTLVFVQHVLEIAALKGSASETAGGPEYQLQESVVADQISLLSREWGWVCPAGLVGRWPGVWGLRAT